MPSSPRPLLARILLSMLPVVALTLPAGAQNIAGSGQLFAKDKLAAKGCGRAVLTGPQTLTMEVGGTWTAIDDGGDALSGTYVPVGAKGRKFDLNFDAPSLVLLRGMLEENLSELCQAIVQVTTIDTKRFRLKLNRRGTKANVKAKIRLIGTANGQPGKGSFKVKAKGPWTVVPPASPSGAFLDDDVTPGPLLVPADVAREQDQRDALCRRIPMRGAPESREKAHRRLTS
jgi:hypothetical protein